MFLNNIVTLVEKFLLLLLSGTIKRPIKLSFADSCSLQNIKIIESREKLFVASNQTVYKKKFLEVSQKEDPKKI